MNRDTLIFKVFKLVNEYLRLLFFSFMKIEYKVESDNSVYCKFS